MSLLGNQTMIKENDYLFALTGGGGGGGAVNRVTGGLGITCNPNTGNVNVYNDGVVSITAGNGISTELLTFGVTRVSNTGILDVLAGSGIGIDILDNVATINTTGNPTNISEPFNSTNTEGIGSFTTYDIGTFNKEAFYNIDNHFYTCNLSFTISALTVGNPFTGTLLVTLTYGGVSSYATIVISDTYSQSYAVNLGLGFLSTDVNVLVYLIFIV